MSPIDSAANAFPMGFPLANKSASIAFVIVFYKLHYNVSKFNYELREICVWCDFIALVIGILDLRRSVGKHLKYA